MINRLLNIPARWIEELATALADQGRPLPGRVALPLTQRAGLADKLAAIGVSRNEVIADLRSGFTSDRRNGSNGEYFCLSGSRFDVFVSTAYEEDALQQGRRLPLAVVTSVKPRNGRLPYRGPAFTTDVSFNPPYDKCVCDIAAVHENIQARLRHERALRQARGRSAQLLKEEPGWQTGHADLHAQVRRHFSALQHMIDLLQLRSETEDTRQVDGTVLDPRDPASDVHPDTLCVRVRGRYADFESGMAVRVSVPNTKMRWNLELVAVEEDLFYLDPPTSGRPVPGTYVDVTYAPRFSLGRHGYALNRFLREEIEGDWDALARLISDQASLDAPESFPPPPAYFDEHLNEEQRLAVAGALGTPHAFFIQGPPGTGKTTVICEIVRQLVARGERVLLLAPMHVAVDEVLRRVGQASGVLALRASWDDSRVRADLRCFTKDNLAAEFVRRVRRPGASKAESWLAEGTELAAERKAIVSALAARNTLARARADLTQATTARNAWQSAHLRAVQDAAKTETIADRDKQAAQLRLAEAETRLHTATLMLSQAEAAGSTLYERLKAAFGAGELGRLRRAHREATAELNAVQKAWDQAADRHAERTAFVRRLADDGRRRGRQHDEACAAAAEQLHSAERQAASADRSLAGRALAEESDAELAERCQRSQKREERLQQLTYLENRWFQLTGLAQASSEPDRQRIVGDLGDQLVRSANLVCCTTIGFGGDKDIRDADYDTLIVDEASRVIDSEFLIGAKQARRWILVGDEHQLPPYVEAADEHHLHALAALHMVERGAQPALRPAVDHLGRLWKEEEDLHRFRDESVEHRAAQMRDSGHWREVYRKPYVKAYERLRHNGADAERELLAKMRDHLVRSLFERCVTRGPGRLRQALIEQRRMIDPIAELVRKPVYGGQYRSPSPEQLRKMGVTPLTTGQSFPRPVVFLDTSDHPKAGQQQAGTGFVNELEADWIAAACRIWERELAARGESTRVTVSVLTFYKAQAREIRRRLGAPGYPGFHVLKFEVIDSIDRIQGQQSDLVIISFCRTRRGRQRELTNFGLWLQDVRRLNVACSRARRAILLVGHKNTLAGMRGVPAAERFYQNMFGLFEPGNPHTVLLKQLDESAG
jgi:hypothetical protein